MGEYDRISKKLKELDKEISLLEREIEQRTKYEEVEVSVYHDLDEGFQCSLNIDGYTTREKVKVPVKRPQALIKRLEELKEQRKHLWEKLNSPEVIREKAKQYALELLRSRKFIIHGYDYDTIYKIPEEVKEALETARVLGYRKYIILALEMIANGMS